MKKIKDIISKPSEAVRAMIAGLKEADSIPNFAIDMGTFGHINAVLDVCFGCAATCAVQHLTGNSLSPDHADFIMPLDFSDLSKVHGVEMHDLKEFEIAIDYLRIGDAGSIFEYFGLEEPEWVFQQSKYLTELTNTNWKKRLPDYEIFANKLEKAGF